MALDPKKWTLKTNEAFAAAIDQAKALSNPELTPDHVLAALMRQDDTIVPAVLAKLGLAPLMVRNKADEAVGKLPKAYGGQDTRMNRELDNVVQNAQQYQNDLKDDFLSVEHLLLAMNARLGIGSEELLQALKEVRGSHRVTSQNPEENFAALEKYGQDLTQRARDGKIDPVIGRDDEIRRVILSQARKAIADALGLEAPAGLDHPDFAKRGASFVTLTIDGELRGCIGSLNAHRALGDDVRSNAVSAALSDPRFPPLPAAEFGKVPDDWR